MKYFNLTKQLAVIAVVALFSSCEKADKVEPLGDGGATIVKILGGGSETFPGADLKAIDFVATSQTFNIVDIRRDAKSQADLNKPMTILIQDDTAALNVYNADLISQGLNPLTYMPSTFYDLDPTVTKAGGDGGTYTVNLAAGEFAKLINITVPDATVFDPSTQYALPFTITSVDAGGEISSINTFICIIGAKNQYDGRYELNFSNYHPSLNPGYTGDVVEVEMWTTGANTVKIYWDGGFYNPAVLSGSLTAFGSQEPEYTIDPATNDVTVQNAFAGAVTFYTMNSTYNNRYDPSEKKIYCKWGYRYTAGAFDPATTREWTQEFTYLGPR